MLDELFDELFLAEHKAILQASRGQCCGADAATKAWHAAVAARDAYAKLRAEVVERKVKERGALQGPFHVERHDDDPEYAMT